MFRVGQKVVCVDASHWKSRRTDADQKLVLSAVYTIQAIEGTHFEFPSVKIEELYPDKWMRANRFRPIVERKTDISIFTAMLTPTKVRA